MGMKELKEQSLTIAIAIVGKTVVNGFKSTELKGRVISDGLAHDSQWSCTAS